MFSKKDENIVKSILGDAFIDDLSKSEVGAIVNAQSKTAVFPAEVQISLQIVPRSILSFLFANLKQLKKHDVHELHLPFTDNAYILINKHGPDNYSGEIIQHGVKLVEYDHRSLPAIGLLLLSTFELYDLDLLDEIKNVKNNTEATAKIDNLQNMIDERLMLNRYVQDVVDRRITQREAIDQLIKEKLHTHILQTHLSHEQEDPHMDEEKPMETKKSKLKLFLENREKLRQQTVNLDKSEVVCPDCAVPLYKNNDKALTLCICYGQFHNKEIKIKKYDNGKVNLQFPKQFDIDDVEMLLDAIKGHDKG